MRFRLQLITVGEDGSERMHSVVELERDSTLRLETTGLTLAEATHIFNTCRRWLLKNRLKPAWSNTGAARYAASHCPPKAIIRSNYGGFCNLQIRSPRF